MGSKKAGRQLKEKTARRVIPEGGESKAAQEAAAAVQGASAGRPEASTRENEGTKKQSRASATASHKEGVFKFVAHKTALLGNLREKEEAEAWYDFHQSLEGANDTMASIGKKYKSATNSEATIYNFRQLAQRIYQHELTLVSGDDDRWMESTIRKGTLKDRIAASSVSVAALPVHRLGALDGLLRMAGASAMVDGGRGRPNARIAIMAMEALADLFVSNLLPPSRKLIKFEHRPLCLYDATFDSAGSSHDKVSHVGKRSGSRSLSPRVLLLWYYEDQLKQKYHAFVSQCLSRMISDQSLELVQRTTSIRTAATLLKAVPEGEVTLLHLIVNKLGDPHRKIAAAVSHQLRNVLQEHELMRLTVAREVQQLTHRPNLSPRALYNCIIFLNQLRLDDDDDGSDLPEMLVNTYFKLFEVAIHKTEVPSKGSKRKSGKSKKDETRKRQQASDEPSTTNATGAVSTEAVSMKGRLLSALLTGINRAYPYVRSSYFDTDGLQNLDALYRIIHTSPPAACTQALMLLYQLTAASNETENRKPTKADSDDTSKKNVDRFYRALYAKLLDTSMIHSRQVAMYFNVIYKAMKYDTSSERVVAFAKRLLHATLHAPSSSPVLIASLYLLSETVTHQPALAESMKSVLTKEFDPQKREPSAVFGADDDDEQDKDATLRRKKKRQQTGSLWELSLLNCHYHPTVQKFAAGFGEGESIEYTGDPLKDFTLARFLDKMAIRNPKMWKRRDQTGDDRTEREDTEDATEDRLAKDGDSADATSNGTDSAMINDENEIFHRFFAEKERREKLRKETAGKAATGEAHVRDEQEEERFTIQLTEKLLMDAAGGGPVDIDDEPHTSMWEESTGPSDADEVPVDGYIEDDDDFDVDPKDLAWDEEGEESSDDEEEEDDVLAMAFEDEDEDKSVDDNEDEKATSSDDDQAIGHSDNGGPDDSDDEFGIDKDGGDVDDTDEDEEEEDGFTSAFFSDEELVQGFVDADEYEELIAQGAKERGKRRSNVDVGIRSNRSAKRKKSTKKV